MGKSYKMRCRHCGAEFLHIERGVVGVLKECACCESHIVTEISIRCPQCAQDGFFHKQYNPEKTAV